MAGGRPAGGSCAAADLIARHGDAIEADLARYYGVDMRNLYRRPRTPEHPLRAALRHRVTPYACGLVAALLGVAAWLAPWTGALAPAFLLVLIGIGWHALAPPALPPTAALTPRRFLNLVRYLPASSATVAALRGGEQYRGWDTDRYLLALVGDLLQQLIYVQVMRGNPKRKPAKPEPLPRPGDTDQKAKPRNAFAATALEHLRTARNAKGSQ